MYLNKNDVKKYRSQLKGIDFEPRYTFRNYGFVNVVLFLCDMMFCYITVYVFFC